MNDLEADLLIANAKIKQLEQELSESQRREQAAVEDILCRDHCDVCVSGRERDGECEVADYDCQTCKSETCRCRECRGEDKWQWRGPQEAGEGERMIKSVEMNRIAGTAKSFGVSVVDDGYIRIYGGMVSLGRRCANKRRDEMSVSVADIKAAIAEYEAAQAGEGGQ